MASVGERRAAECRDGAPLQAPQLGAGAVEVTQVVEVHGDGG
jgi:hypothetical protein